MKKAITKANVYDHHTGSYQQSTVYIEDGIIRQVGQGLEIPSDAEIVDASGRYMTPGLIDTFTQLGLKESGIRWEGEDQNEPTSDPHSKELSVIDGIYPFDRSFEDARANGITTVHVTPGSTHVLSGQTAIIKTSGTVVDEMVISAGHGYALSLGELPKQWKREKFQYPITRMGIAQMVRDHLLKAQAEVNRAGNESVQDEQSGIDNLAHESSRAGIFRQIVQGQCPLYVRAHRSDDIITAIRLKKEFPAVNMVLVHATEAHMVSEHVAEAQLSVCAGPFFVDRKRYELKNLTPYTSKALEASQIPFSLTTDHPTSAQRNLGLEVALAIREGVDSKTSISAVTLQAAKQLGLEQSLGSIESGKQADLVLWNGEPFELTTRVEQTLIAGKTVFNREGESS